MQAIEIKVNRNTLYKNVKKGVMLQCNNNNTDQHIDVLLDLETQDIKISARNKSNIYELPIFKLTDIKSWYPQSSKSIADQVNKKTIDICNDINISPKFDESKNLIIPNGLLTALRELKSILEKTTEDTFLFDQKQYELLKTINDTDSNMIFLIEDLKDMEYINGEPFKKGFEPICGAHLLKRGFALLNYLNVICG